MKPTVLKEVIKKQYVMCVKIPIYFMKKYCMVQHPMKGKVPFHLYEYQEQSLQTFETHRFNVILKDSQVRVININCWLLFMDDDIS